MRKLILALAAFGLAVTPLTVHADNDSRRSGDPDAAYEQQKESRSPARQMESVPPSEKGGRDNPQREQAEPQAPEQDQQDRQARKRKRKADKDPWWWLFDGDDEDPYYDRSRRHNRL